MSSDKTYLDLWREAVWASLDLTPTEKLVLLAMGLKADWRTGENCRPGAALIVKLTGLSRSCVLRTLTGLERRPARGKRSAGKGWLEVKTRGRSVPGQPRTTTVYRLIDPARTVGTERPVADRLQSQELTTVVPEPRTVGTEAPFHLRPPIDHQAVDPVQAMKAHGLDRESRARAS